MYGGKQIKIRQQGVLHQRLLRAAPSLQHVDYVVNNQVGKIGNKVRVAKRKIGVADNRAFAARRQPCRQQTRRYGFPRTAFAARNHDFSCHFPPRLLFPPRCRENNYTINFRARFVGFCQIEGAFRENAPPR